jgi:hypothetical protein
MIRYVYLEKNNINDELKACNSTSMRLNFIWKIYFIK